MFKSSLGRLGLLLVSLLGLMSFFSGAAFASGPPIVTVSEATNKSLNTATLNGTVDKNGASGASVKFEYGKTKLYGKSVDAPGAYASEATPVAVNVVGLEPLTTYHFRIVSTNSFGTTFSEDMTFEMLLAWRVEGKLISELVEHPILENESLKTLEPITIERMSLGKLAKVTCESYFTKHLVVLDTEYNLPFKNCKGTWGGVEYPACNPPDSELHLNAFAQTTSNQNLKLDPKCPFGESIPLTGGYALQATPEAQFLHLTMTKVNSNPFTTIPWTINYGPVEWWMGIGEYKGHTFGIL